MGKALIIKGADFSANAVSSILPSLSPTIIKDGYWNYQTGVYTHTDSGGTKLVCNEYFIHVVSGKTYTISNDLNGMGYDLIFYNSSKEVVSWVYNQWTDTDLNVIIPSNCTYMSFNLWDHKPVSSDMNVKITGTTTDAQIYEEETD